CSFPCLVNADFGSCSPSDDVCLCNSPAFVDSTSACIDSVCSGSDLAQADAAAVYAC
ncbi:hypothetical protein BV25DRAFT_1772886, partial [Artomyces pyxidatus]